MGLQAHGSGQPHPEVTVEHFAADRNPAEIHVQTHQAECLAVHRELLGQLRADVQAFGLGQVDQPGPHVGAGPVAGVDGQSVGTVVDLLAGGNRRWWGDHRGGHRLMMTLTVVVMVMEAVGVRPPAVTFVGQHTDRGQIQRRDAPFGCAFYLHRGFNFGRNLEGKKEKEKKLVIKLLQFFIGSEMKSTIQRAERNFPPGRGRQECGAVAAGGQIITSDRGGISGAPRRAR